MLQRTTTSNNLSASNVLRRSPRMTDLSTSNTPKRPTGVHNWSSLTEVTKSTPKIHQRQRKPRDETLVKAGAGRCRKCLQNRIPDTIPEHPNKHKPRTRPVPAERQKNVTKYSAYWQFLWTADKVEMWANKQMARLDDVGFGYDSASAEILHLKHSKFMQGVEQYERNDLCSLIKAGEHLIKTRHPQRGDVFHRLQWLQRKWFDLRNLAAIRETLLESSKAFFNSRKLLPSHGSSRVHKCCSHLPKGFNFKRLF